jgi:hypothetical protein
MYRYIKMTSYEELAHMIKKDEKLEAQKSQYSSSISN